MKLKSRLFIMILPVVTITFFLSGLFASLETRTALIKIANRHLAFKAEELRDYFYSEWEVISNLGLTDQEEFLEASKNSFFSYAYSLLRSESEVIYIFNSEGEYLHRISLGLQQESMEKEVTDLFEEGIPEPGWFTGTIMGEHRVGVHFLIDVREWIILVTEKDEVFLKDIKNMQTAFIIIILGALSTVFLFLSLFISAILRPLTRLKKIMTGIHSSGDLSGRAEIEYSDEIGDLAITFNSLVQSLQENYKKLEETSIAEVEARITAVKREEETLMLLSRVSDLNNEETGAHVRRIGVLSAELGRFYGLDAEKQQLLLHGAPLHDIGKIGISEAILTKKGKLTPEEYSVMKKHTLIGYELLKDTQSKFLLEGALISLSHHERWDGGGYPRGIKGENINLSGRIVGLVDVFDALISERPYKKAWTPERAREYIVSLKNEHFDAHLVDLFDENFERFKELSMNR